VKDQLCLAGTRHICEIGICAEDELSDDDKVWNDKISRRLRCLALVLYAGTTLLTIAGEGGAMRRHC
jgi:hypothetical protein